MHRNHSTGQYLCLWCLDPILDTDRIFEWFHPQPLCCRKCRSLLQQRPIQFNLPGLSITACVEYNEPIQRLLYQFKEDGDLPLAPLFFHYAKTMIHKRFKGHTLIPMPSSIQKTKERGFVPLECMSKQIKLPQKQGFIKTKEFKQSLTSKPERSSISSVIALHPNFDPTLQPICLLDDVCTTGSTLLAAANHLPKTDKPIVALVFAVHPLLLQQASFRREK